MNNFMEMAIDEARKGMRHNHGGPFGAIVVKDGKILSRTHNEVLRTNDPTAHAEILAIREASATLERFDLSDCVIYTSSQPCPMCLAAIYWARIRTVYYGSDKDDVADIGFDDSLFYRYIRGEEKEVELELINTDREKCLELLREWSEKSDKQMY
ncbi:nucleoside deaminase [Methanolobus profundi]|uniref:Guanine deaminase n=1 Tax=Methanolobus profundi TaxID=487685 RepID=A0A1I4P9Q1_9EURY|nr:nucleoside deaminase [Methanolobus profundi]SFM24439.1 guanine deaminase [Methanolobus profundi]